MTSRMQEYSFTVTGYAGFEDEILRLRNANRSNAQTRGYLDWRYRGLVNAPEPKVFWIRSASGHAVGMSSLIFRRYWENNRQLHLAVLGDISLDANSRGKGLGQQLFKFVRRYIDEHLPDCSAFVIPNAAAQTGLTSAAWRIGGRLTSYVFLLDPTEKLHGLLRYRWLAMRVAWLIKKFISGILQFHLQQGCSMHLVAGPDDSFQALWKTLPKEGLILRDRGLASLTWRYADHPHEQFKFAKFTRSGELLGYVIFKLSQEDKTCFVYDIVVTKQEDLKSIVALFVMHCNDREDIGTIRLLLNDNHPYCRNLWMAGFIPRRASGVFQVYLPNGRAQEASCTWAITWGDKDI